MYKVSLDKMDICKFMVCVLAFILIFCFIFMTQTKSVINFQNKILEKYLEVEKPEITSTSTQNEMKKYSIYE